MYAAFIGGETITGFQKDTTHFEILWSRRFFYINCNWPQDMLSASKSIPCFALNSSLKTVFSVHTAAYILRLMCERKSDLSRKYQQERSEAVKKMILDAAEVIGTEDGFDNITVRKLSDKIGYSTGVIYYHFRDKQEIISELRHRRDQEAYHAVKSIIKTDSTLYDNLLAVFNYIAELPFNNRDVYVRYFTSNRRRSGDLSTFGENWIKLIRYICKISVDRGEIEADRFDEKCLCMMSFIIGYDTLFLELCPTDKDASQKLARTMTDIIMTGMAARH